MIRVGDIWYGPHNCMLTTEIITEVQNTEEVILPDFVEVKAEEIYDVIDDSDIDNDIFDEAPSNVSDDLQHMPYSMKQLKKDVKLDKNKAKGTEQLTSLTEDQLQSRICPICQKMIVNKTPKFSFICYRGIRSKLKI